MRTLIPFSLCATILLLPAAASAGQKSRAEQLKASPLTKEESAKLIEAAIRKAAKKLTGELTKADLEKVKKLDLSGNQLTDVKGLEKLTKLEVLYLGSNKLTDVRGLEKLTQLEVLELNNNQLTNVKGLEKLTKLDGLRLDGNPTLTRAQITELRKALPKCQIYPS